MSDEDESSCVPNSSLTIKVQYPRGMTKEECEAHIIAIAQRGGAKTLFAVWLQKNGHEQLAQRYHRFVDNSYEEISRRLNFYAEYVLEKQRIIKARSDAGNARFQDRPQKVPYVWSGQYPRAMSEETCENFLSSLYQEFGIKSLFRKWLRKNGHGELYNRYISFPEASLATFAEKHNYSIERNQHEKTLKREKYALVSESKTKWTEEVLRLEIVKVVKEFGFLPPSPFLQTQNGFQGLAGAIQKFGGIKKIKETYNITDRLRLFDKQGSIWNSFPEAALSNYLLSKGIKAKKGERYPVGYSESSEKAYGIYDMHFIASAGFLSGRKLNIEIWGGNPGGRGEEDYAKVRAAKEAFSRNDSCFIGVEHRDCYSIIKLERIFNIHIAPMNSLIEGSSSFFDAPLMSLADEVLVRLKKVCERMSDGLLPSRGWFLREEKFKDREIGDWEASTWAGLVDNISDCGGIMKFRAALGQTDEHLRKHQISKDDTISGLTKFFNEYKQTPQAFRCHKKRGLSADEEQTWDRSLELSSGISRHFSSTFEACQAAGVPMFRHNVYKTAEEVMKDLIMFYKDHGGRSPRSIEKELRKKPDKTEEEKDMVTHSYRLQTNAARFFESYGDAWQTAIAAGEAEHTT